jgi:hypothetical protein
MRQALVGLSSTMSRAAWEGTVEIMAHAINFEAAPIRRASPRAIHAAILAAVFLTFTTSGVVFTEPAPVDVLMIGLVLLLPAAGLLRVTPRLAAYLALWGIVGAAGLVASAQAEEIGEPTKFTLVSIYLYVASFTIAAFVARDPVRHGTVVMAGWMVAALIAAGAGFVGYFKLLPGAFDLFTKFDRLSGTFKDPNVMGAFLVAPFLYALHLVLHRRSNAGPLSAVLPLLVAAVLALATLLTFSRGAWLNLALALGLYAVLAYALADSAKERARIVGAGAAGVVLLVLVVLAVVQDEKIAGFMQDRAALTQSYDEGPAGRFGGQSKAFGLILDHPLGIGAGRFALDHHHEEVHNVFPSVWLNNGWIGGLGYWFIVALTLGIGAQALRQSVPGRPLLLVALAAFTATAGEGIVIDTDHWRSFYVLMALVWGFSAETSTSHLRR